MLLEVSWSDSLSDFELSEEEESEPEEEIINSELLDSRKGTSTGPHKQSLVKLEF